MDQKEGHKTEETIERKDEDKVTATDRLFVGGWAAEFVNGRIIFGLRCGRPRPPIVLRRRAVFSAAFNDGNGFCRAVA